jgi:tetratricopeptide (TPR) repeat protein
LTSAATVSARDSTPDRRPGASSVPLGGTSTILALAAAALHPAPLALLLGLDTPGIAERGEGAAATLISAVSHLADVLVTVVRPGLLAVRSVTDTPTLTPIAALSLVIGGCWIVTLARTSRVTRWCWWSGVALALGSWIAPRVALWATPPVELAWTARAAAVAADVLVVVALLTLVAGFCSRAPRLRVFVLFLAFAASSAASATMLPQWRSPHGLVAAALRVSPQDARVHVAAADDARTRGNEVAELDFLRHALTLAPSDVVVRRTLGLAYARRAAWAEADRHLAKAVGSPAGDAELDLAAAEAASRSGRAPRACRELGAALSAEAREGDARRAFDCALDVDPGDREAALELAWLLATSPGDRKENDETTALRLAEAAVAGRPPDASDLDVLAAAQAATGDFAAAEATAKRALEVAATYGDAKWNREVEARAGLYARGLRYERAVDLAESEAGR